MRDKRDVIRLHVKNGVTNLGSIRESYNTYSQGGNLYGGTTEKSNQMEFSLAPDKYSTIPQEQLAPTVQQRQTIERNKFLQTNPTFQQPISKPTSSEKAGQFMHDVGSKTLNAITTFGGSAIGDVINDISTEAANAVSKYSFGMIQQTSQEYLESNRNGQWVNRLNNSANAVNSQLTGELIGAGIGKGIEYIGSKVAPKMVRNFKSEINWGNWNSEIPKNTELLKEYSKIEKSSKVNESWMKNIDGSEFNGTPEQFIQQNSNNFKNAFTNGFEDVYRGVNRHDNEFLNNKGVFTADKKLAGESYTPSNKKNNILSYNSKPSEGGVHNLYRKNSDNFIEMDSRGSTWDHVDLTKSRLNNIEFNKNIELLTEQVAKTKDNISKRMSSGSNVDGDYVLDGLSKRLKRLSAELEYNKKSLLNSESINKNSDMFLKMRNDLGNETTTRDMAKYIEDANLDYIKLNSIDDAGIGDVTIVNHKPGNYLKSMIGNNGMFDMNNSNIYKSLIPAGFFGYGLSQSK